MKGQIEKRSEGVYRLRWFQGRVKGRRVYGSRTVRGTLKQAEKALREILARGDSGLAIPSPARIPTLEAFVEKWGEATIGLRERTVRDYLDILKRHVIPALGSRRLDAIHALDIEERLVKPLVSKGHNRTARLAVSVLSRVYRSALRDRTLGLVGNPCHGVESARATRRPMRPLDAEERAAFRKAIEGTPFEDLFILMMLSGMGPGEALALDWQHVDLEAGTLRVAQTLDTTARKIVNDTKRQSRKRTLPMVPEVRTMLRRRWLAKGRPETGLLFTASNGEPIDISNLRSREFKGALRRAGIARSVRMYDLRHGFATAALEAGADVRTVADLMGHSSTRTTLDVYSHVSDDRKRETAERIAAKLSGA